MMAKIPKNLRSNCYFGCNTEGQFSTETMDIKEKMPMIVSKEPNKESGQKHITSTGTVMAVLKSEETDEGRRLEQIKSEHNCHKDKCIREETEEKELRTKKEIAEDFSIAEDNTECCSTEDEEEVLTMKCEVFDEPLIPGKAEEKEVRLKKKETQEKEHRIEKEIAGFSIAEDDTECCSTEDEEEVLTMKCEVFDEPLIPEEKELRLKKEETEGKEIEETELSINKENAEHFSIVEDNTECCSTEDKEEVLTMKCEVFDEPLIPGTTEEKKVRIKKKETEEKQHRINKENAEDFSIVEDNTECCSTEDKEEVLTMKCEVFDEPLILEEKELRLKKEETEGKEIEETELCINKENAEHFSIVEDNTECCSTEDKEEVLTMKCEVFDEPLIPFGASHDLISGASHDVLFGASHVTPGASKDVVSVKAYPQITLGPQDVCPAVERLYLLEVSPLILQERTEDKELRIKKKETEENEHRIKKENAEDFSMSVDDTECCNTKYEEVLTMKCQAFDEPLILKKEEHRTKQDNTEDAISAVKNAECPSVKDVEEKVTLICEEVFQESLHLKIKKETHRTEQANTENASSAENNAECPSIEYIKKEITIKCEEVFQEPLHPKRKKEEHIINQDNTEDAISAEKNAECPSIEDVEKEKIILKREVFQEPLHPKIPATRYGQGRGNRRSRRGRSRRLRGHEKTQTEIKIFMIDELPHGTPLETPLHPKRRRTMPDDQDNFNYSKYAQPSTSSANILRNRILVGKTEDTPQEAKTAGKLETTSVDSAEPTQNGDQMMHGPTSLFDFDWQEFPSTPFSPHLRRETFVGNCGPMIGHISSPYEAFLLIWDRPIMEHIVFQTNLYAQEYPKQLLLQRKEIEPSSNGESLWRDTNADELYVYFGLLVAMSILVKSKLEDYWSTNTDTNIFSTPDFSTHMSLERFQQISKYLHFNNNANVSSDTLTRSQAKIYKVAPVVDHLNIKFSSLYGLSQNIAVDKSLAQWKGYDKQFNPKKVAPADINTYEVCDCRTGYFWRFECHIGNEVEDQQVVISGSISNLVLRLLRGLEYRGHTVWMDSYYNSPALARVLKSLGYDCVGTLRTNRQFVPAQINNLKKDDMRVGQVCGCTSGDVDLMVWRDQNRVALLSTYHGIDMSENKPILIKDYNVCVGEVDKRDQTLLSYPMERKGTHVWYKKFFRRLLNVSLFNAYVLYKHSHDIDHRQFRIDLVTEILHKHQQFRSGIVVAAIPGLQIFSHDVINHLPVEVPVLPEGDKTDNRQCVICTKDTHYVCHECNVALCVNFSDTTSCYITYHT